MNRLLRILATCENVFAAVATAIFVALTLSICAEVLMRYGFDRPISWVVEISEYALLWITFLGAPYVLREGGHVRVDILMQHLSPAGLRFCGLLASASGAVSMLALGVFGTHVTLTEFARHSFKPTGIDVPTWIVVSVIPFGSVVMLVRFIRMFVEYFSGGRDFGAEPSH